MGIEPTALSLGSYFRSLYFNDLCICGHKVATWLGRDVLEYPPALG